MSKDDGGPAFCETRRRETKMNADYMAVRNWLQELAITLKGPLYSVLSGNKPTLWIESFDETSARIRCDYEEEYWVKMFVRDENSDYEGFGHPPGEVKDRLCTKKLQFSFSIGLTLTKDETLERLTEVCNEIKRLYDKKELDQQIAVQENQLAGLKSQRSQYER